MPKIDSLYELIKKTSKDKGRKLKIICDWDDCLQPVKPMAIYKESSELSASETFEEFWKNFWSFSTISTRS